jgi:hypothetical protein
MRSVSVIVALFLGDGKHRDGKRGRWRPGVVVGVLAVWFLVMSSFASAGTFTALTCHGSADLRQVLKHGAGSSSGPGPRRFCSRDSSRD